MVLPLVALTEEIKKDQLDGTGEKMGRWAEKLDVKAMDEPYAALEDIEDCEPRELNAKEKDEIRNETGWSDEIVDSIGSMEEYEIYRDAGLVEVEINGKACLIRPDIDLTQKDGFGRTNQERMEQGLAPLALDGRPYELHHIGQHADSPLAELTMQEHRGKGNDTILHIKTKESEIDRVTFDEERGNHWASRAEEVDVDG
jgi:hypothetical protein